MLARRRDQVIGGKLLEQLDVGYQTGPRERPLEQIVAQQRVLGDPLGQSLLESVEVVDALAGVRSLREQVLVDIGHRGRVGVDAGRPGRDALERRRVPLGRKRRGDPRLEDPVAPGDAAGATVQPRPIQRVRDRADEARHRSAGQARIGIEGHHIAHARRWCGAGQCRGEVVRFRGPAKERIQLVELPALSLPAHPPGLALVPPATAMEQEEPRTPARGLAVPLVEHVDRGDSRGEEVVVIVELLGWCIAPVRQQRKPHVPVGVAQVVDLEVADLLLNVGLTQEERRDGHEGPQRSRHAFFQLEAHDLRRPHRLGGDPVDEGDRQVRSGSERNDREHENRRPGRPGCADEQRNRDDQGGRQDDRPDIEARRSGGPSHAFDGSLPNSEGSGETAPTLADEVIAGICLALPLRHRVSAGARSGNRHVRRRPPRRNRCSSNLDLRHARRAGQLLHGVAIPVARGEVHVRENAVLAEGRVDQARALHERGPVEPGEEAHARDHIADRHVHLGLALVLAANGLLRCRALGGELLLQPAKGGSRRRILVAQALE